MTAATKRTLRGIRARRAKRTKAKIFGTAERPRLAVFRSNRYTSAQLIDDTKGATLVAVSSREEAGGKEKKTKSERAQAVGERLAKKAMEKGIMSAAFDRRSYSYQGRVKAVADGARKAGLKI